MENYKVGSIVEMKKPHPCSPTSKNWEIIEVGADVRIKCCHCGHILQMKRYDFDIKIVKIVGEK